MDYYMVIKMNKLDFLIERSLHSMLSWKKICC